MPPLSSEAVKEINNKTRAGASPFLIADILWRAGA